MVCPPMPHVYPKAGTYSTDTVGVLLSLRPRRGLWLSRRGNPPPTRWAPEPSTHPLPPETFDVLFVQPKEVVVGMIATLANDLYLTRKKVPNYPR